MTGVATYANYQLISRRGVGPGWVMVGDAFGFVDPMLSPGVFTALRSAERVADALAPFLRQRTTPSPAELGRALQPYAAAQTAMLTAWQDLIAYFYDGRLLALLHAGRDWMAKGPNRLKTGMQNHIERHIALQATERPRPRATSRPPPPPEPARHARRRPRTAGHQVSRSGAGEPPTRGGFTATYSLRQPPIMRCSTPTNPLCRKAARIVSGGTHSSIVSQ